MIPVTTQQLLNGNAFSTLMAPQRNIWLSMKKTYSPFGGRPDPPPPTEESTYIHLISMTLVVLAILTNAAHSKSKWPTSTPEMDVPSSFISFFLPHLYDLIQLIQNQLITIMSILDFTLDVNHFVFDFSEFFM